jgi:hypothetical protein
MPVRSALAGTALPVLAVAAAFTFGANLLHLVHSPRLYGQNWDAAIDLQFQAITPQQTQQIAGRAAGLSSWSIGNHGTVAINGQIVPAIGIAPGRGPLVSPTLLSGQPPRTGDQIVLGTPVLRQIGRTVGQMVTVTVSGHQQQDRIVGRRPLLAGGRTTTSCCCVSHPARTGPPASPASPGPWPASAERSSRPRAW